MSKTQKTFMAGAMILAVAGVLSKVLGAIFRIPLTNFIGAEGMGYYQAAYPVYTLILIVSQAGFPVAISRLVSERVVVGDYYGAHRVYRVSLTVMAIVGTFFTLLLWFLAEPLTRYLEDLNGAVHAMRAIAPAIFFVTIMSAQLGYFQGLRNMRPSAVIQVVEQLFRVGIGLLLAYLLLSKGKDYAAAGATFGATAGGIAGFLVVMLIYIAFRRTRGFDARLEASHIRFQDQQQSVKTILSRLFAITIPITIGASIMPIMYNLDLVIVANRLSAAGWNPEDVRSMYGQLTAMAGSVVNLPFVLTEAMAISIVPTVVAAWKMRDTRFLHRNVTLSIQVTSIIAMPCMIGMMALAKPIMLLLYPTQKEDAIAAAPSFFILAIGILFLGLNTSLTAVLQGVGRQGVPVRNMFIGALFKALFTFVLTGIPALNIRGAAAGTVIAYLIAAVLNTLAVKKYTRARIEWSKSILRPFISALVMGGLAYLSHKLLLGILGNSLSTLVGVALGGICYVVMLFVTKAVTEEELAGFPKGKTLVKMYRKVLTRNSKGARM
ncbi:MAG: polysaccharide biosynthesis protein [Clostridiales Family XIII bacterium]|jgi:stage V sporulation protein B|nr:polysaccharide biosynthesis protein [Clostridiales Family XIII bacterium]